MWKAPIAEQETAFWNFVTARQEIWFNKTILKLPREQWTSNPVLQIAKFTNVYRLLDRNTQYCVEEILEPEGYDWERLARLLTYRWFNRIETFNALAHILPIGMTSNATEPYIIATAIQQYANSTKTKLFTGAYLCGVSDQGGGDSKELNYALIFCNMYRAIDNILELLNNPACSLENLCQSLQILPCIGGFISYQFALDMMYPLQRLKGNSLAPYCDVNSYCDIGPGCKKGLACMGVVGNNTLLLRACRELYGKHVSELHRRGFKWIRTDIDEAVPLSLGDIENCLCEFSKFDRIAKGGHIKTKYHPLPPDAWRAKCETLPIWGKGKYNGCPHYY